MNFHLTNAFSLYMYREIQKKENSKLIGKSIRGIFKVSIFLNSNSFLPFQVRHEIEVRTMSRAGNNRGISREPIKITITSTDVPDLEIIDLPGFTRNPVGNAHL